MKKSLIALAVAGVVSAPAFAATSNVDIYGVMNVSVNMVDDNDYENGDNNLSVVSNASRIGFKGTEDLGGGLSAIWQIETGFEADEKNDNKSEFANRNTFVGVKGGFGTVLMGKHDTPMKLLGRKIDNFGDTMADSRNILGASDDDNGSSAFDLRTPNTIAYVSPTMSGVTVAAAYVSDWGSNGADIDDNQVDAYSLSAVYENGPIMLGAAYETHNDGAWEEIMWRVVGGFTMGNAKIGGQYEKIQSDDDDRQRSAWGVFANYTMGAFTLKANYLTVGDEDGSNNDGAKQYTVGADYALSKRTTVYGLYAKLNNDTWADYRLGAGAGASDMVSTGTKGDDQSVLSLGVKHSF